MTDTSIAAEIADALDRMVQLSCWSMLPLWLSASGKLRAKLDADPVLLDAEPRLRKPLSASSQSKYKALACWRHGVIWKGLDSGKVLEGVPAEEPELQNFEEDARIMRAIYFRPCPDTTPFSFSRKKFASPELNAEELAEEEILRASVRSCWASLRILQLIHREEEGGPRSDLLWLAIKYKSLDELLKFKDVRDKPGSNWSRSWPHEGENNE